MGAVLAVTSLSLADKGKPQQGDQASGGRAGERINKDERKEVGEFLHRYDTGF